MSYFDQYVNRVGVNLSEDIKNNTLDIIHFQFEQSPTYKEILINGANVGARVIDEEKTDEKTLLFKPPFTVTMGSVAELSDGKWILVETFNDEVFPKAKIKQANQILPLTGLQTETQIGTDEFGRPINEYVPTSPTLLPCIVESSIYQPKEDSVITLPNGKILVTIPYTIHDDISDNKEFELYGEKYKIVGIDRTKSVNEVGLMILHCERVI